MAIPSGAPATQLIGGRNWLIRCKMSLSVTTMKRHGWELRELPVQRAISNRSATTSSGTGSGRYCRACRTVRISPITLRGLGWLVILLLLPLSQQLRQQTQLFVDLVLVHVGAQGEHVVERDRAAQPAGFEGGVG